MTISAFDKALHIYANVDVFEALACIRNYIRMCQEEPRKIGIYGGIIYVMKSNEQALFVYQTKTQYVVRQG